MLFGVVPAFAGSSTVVVNASGGPCTGVAPYGVLSLLFGMPSAPTATTITAGLSMVSPGGTVYVCPGTYAEQVKITGAVNLIGLFKNGVPPTIASPSGGVMNNEIDVYDGYPVAAQVLVTNGGNANISGFTIDGSNNGTGCATNLTGVYFKNSFGSLSNSQIVNEVLSSANSGCQSGIGVWVENGNTGYTTIVNTQVSVHCVSISNFQKGGIIGQGPGANVVLDSNTITGIGPTATIAQNGIQISESAAAVLTNNQIYSIDYNAGGTESTGVLVYASKGVSILGNTITGVETPIVTVTDPTDTTLANPNGTADGTVIQSNTISSLLTTSPNVGSSYLADGIDACSSYNTIGLNSIDNTVLDGVHLDQACGIGSSDPSGNFDTVILDSIQNSCSAILIDGPSEQQNFILFDVATGVKESIALDGTCTGKSISNPLQVKVLPARMNHHHGI